MKKNLKLFVCLLAISSGLVACNEKKAESASLVASYSSPAKLTYQNMRPNFNYYITTFTFETLDVYSDNSYQFHVSSSMFSGLVLPNEGNDASGSDRMNYLDTYYGTFTSKDNDLDKSILDITLSKPTRVSSAFDAATFIDTSKWDDNMKKTASSTFLGGDASKEMTAEEYLAKKAFKEITISVTKKTFGFDYFELIVE